jgi:hypothetical protein
VLTRKAACAGASDADGASIRTARERTSRLQTKNLIGAKMYLSLAHSTNDLDATIGAAAEFPEERADLGMRRFEPGLLTHRAPRCRWRTGHGCWQPVPCYQRCYQTESTWPN